MLIALIVIGMFALAAVELWILWELAEREDHRRSGRAVADDETPEPEDDRVPRSRRLLTQIPQF